VADEQTVLDVLSPPELSDQDASISKSASSKSSTPPISNFDRTLIKEQAQIVENILFYHFHLRCFVVVELKKGKLAKSDVRQVARYVTLVEPIQHESDQPTIGLLLCKDYDCKLAEDLLEQVDQPIAIAKYGLTVLEPKPRKPLPKQLLAKPFFAGPKKGKTKPPKKA
jgi:nuclease YhcG-like protein